MNTELGLRERKKQRTRETIARAARELFDERGYHDTTLPEIAEAADVSTRTIFAYFPSKEDILFSDFPVMKEALAQALAERPEGEDALETVRKFILSLHEYKRDDLDEKMRLCIESDETLRSHLRARLASLEELIAPAIAKALDGAEDDLRPQVVAASPAAASTRSRRPARHADADAPCDGVATRTCCRRLMLRRACLDVGRIERDKGDDVLDLKQLDLGDLAEALEDHSYEQSWWLDTKTGEVVLWRDDFEEQGEPDTLGLRAIDPIPSHEGYKDMEDFIQRVRNPQARHLLERAIAGRGAF